MNRMNGGMSYGDYGERKTRSQITEYGPVEETLPPRSLSPRGPSFRCGQPFLSNLSRISACRMLSTCFMVIETLIPGIAIVQAADVRNAHTSGWTLADLFWIPLGKCSQLKLRTDRRC